MKFFLKEKGHFVLAFFVLLIYLSPNIFFQDTARVLKHDNLDSNVVWFKNVADSPNLFGENHSKIDRTLNGLERGLYVSEYRVIVGFYYFLPPQLAYHLNIVLQHLIGFIGMFLLLRDYIFREKEANYIITIVALSFALLPFWPSGGVGVSGLPLLFYVLLNIYSRKSNWKDWLWLFIFPLYSELFLSGLFVVSFFSIYFIYRMFRDKRLRVLIFLSLFIITAIYIVSNYRLFQLILIDGFDTGRELMEFTYGKSLNYKGVLGLSFLEAVRGQHHFHTMAFPFLILFTLVSFVLIKETRKIIFIGFSIIFLLEIGDHIAAWDVMSPLIKKMSFLTQVRFRWKSLTPFLWYLLFSKLIYFWFVHKYKRFLIPLISINLFFVMFSIGDGYRYNNEFAENSFYRTYFDSTNEQNTTFKDFYMLEQFKQLKVILPESSKVACLGILPEIAQYNNYNTFGGYGLLWSKEYENLFEEALGSEAIGHLDHVFYLKSKELDSVSANEKTGYQIKNLELNYSILRQENITHLLSSNLILSDSLTFVSHVENKKGKDIFVYKL